MASLLPGPEPADPVEGALGHFDHTNWVKDSLHALDDGLVRRSGDTIEELIVDKPGSEEAHVRLQGNGTRGIWGQSASGTPRWRLDLGDAVVEGGQDSGSQFALLAYGDTGSFLHTVLSADRQTGLLTVKGPPTADNGIATKSYSDGRVPVGAIIAYAGNTAPENWMLCDGSSTAGFPELAAIVGPNVPDLRSRFIVGAGQSADGTGLSNYAHGSKSGNLETVALTQAQVPLKSHTHTINHSHGAGTSGPGTNHSHTINHTHAAGNTGQAGSHNHGGYHNNWVGSSMDQNPAGTDYSPIGQGPGHPDPPPLAASAPNHAHSFQTPTFSGSSGGEAGHTHSVSVAAHTGSSGSASDAAATAHENRPPYYALTYIIKKV